MWNPAPQLNTPKEPSLLLFQGDNVTYKGLSAPTVRAQLGRIRKLSEERLIRHFNQELIEKISDPEHSDILNHGNDVDRMIDKSWGDMQRLAAAYYHDAPVAEILINFNGYHKLYGTIGDFEETSSQEPALLENFLEKISRINPEIRDRYDTTRLVMQMPDEKRMWIEFARFAYFFVLTVYCMDINGDWIRDKYALDSNGRARYIGSTSEHLEGNYPPPIYPPEVFDPLLSKKWLVSEIKRHVEWLLELYQKSRQ